MVSGERFPRKLRIRRRSEFQRVFAQGRRAFSREMQVVVCENPDGLTRLGLAVGRKVGNAVVRNRIKRRLREVFRRNYDELPEGTDIVVIARPPCVDSAFEDLRATFLRLTSESS